MNIWRVKSKTGATVHLTFDREKTFCNRTVGDDWKFIFLLNDRTEALEHIEGLCDKCNAINLEEWEKEFLLNGNEENIEIPKYGKEQISKEPVAEQEASGGNGKDSDEIKTKPAVKRISKPKRKKRIPKVEKPARANKTRGLGTW